MAATIRRRSILVCDHRTSVSLENDFWDALKEIASARRKTPSELVSAIASGRRDANLSSAIRLFVLRHYRGSAGAAAMISPP